MYGYHQLSLKAPSAYSSIGESRFYSTRRGHKATKNGHNRFKSSINAFNDLRLIYRLYFDYSNPFAQGPSSFEISD